MGNLVVSRYKHECHQHEGLEQASRRASGTSSGPWHGEKVPPNPAALESSGLSPIAKSTPTSGPPARREGHTSVRTDDDSGLDTLWLLKKMDLRSGKKKREKPVRSSKKGWRLHHLTPGGSTTPATRDGGRRGLGAQCPAAATWGPSELGTPTPRRHYTMEGYMPIQDLFQIFFP